MNPEGNTSEARQRILAYFSDSAKRQMAEKGGHPAMRVVMGKHGPKLKTYIAEGAKITGMRVLKQGHISVVGGDMLRSNDAYYPSEPGGSTTQIQSPRTGEWRAQHYYGGDTPRDIIGTIAEITAWFADHEFDAMVIKQEDDYFDTGENVTDFTAEVRLIAFKKKGDKDYVNLGGMATASIEALKGVLGVVTGGIGEAVGTENAFSAVRDVVGTTPDLYELGTKLTGKEPTSHAGEYAFDRALAEQYLELAVCVHEGSGPIHPGRFTTHHVWSELPERGIKIGKSDKSWPVIGVSRIGDRVLGALVPELFDKLEAAVS